MNEHDIYNQSMNEKEGGAVTTEVPEDTAESGEGQEDKKQSRYGDNAPQVAASGFTDDDERRQINEYRQNLLGGYRQEGVPISDQAKQLLLESISRENISEERKRARIAAVDAAATAMNASLGIRPVISQDTRRPDSELQNTEDIQNMGQDLRGHIMDYFSTLKDDASDDILSLPSVRQEILQLFGRELFANQAVLRDVFKEIKARVGLHNAAWVADNRADAFDQIVDAIKPADLKESIFSQPGFVEALEELIDKDGEFFRLRGKHPTRTDKDGNSITNVNARKEDIEATLVEKLASKVPIRSGEDKDKYQKRLEALAKDRLKLALETMDLFSESTYYNRPVLKNGLPIEVQSPVYHDHGHHKQTVMDVASVASNIQTRILEDWDEIDKSKSANSLNSGPGAGDMVSNAYRQLYMERKKTGDMYEGSRYLRRFFGGAFDFGIRRIVRKSGLNHPANDKLKPNGELEAPDDWEDFRDKNILDFIDARHNFAGFPDNYKKLSIKEWSKQVAYMEKNKGAIMDLLKDPIDANAADDVVKAGENHAARNKAYDATFAKFAQVADIISKTPDIDLLGKQPEQVLGTMFLGLLMLKFKDQQTNLPGLLRHLPHSIAQALDTKERSYGDNEKWDSRHVFGALEWAVKSKRIIGEEMAEWIIDEARKLSMAENDKDFEDREHGMLHASNFHATRIAAIDGFWANGQLLRDFFKLLLEGGMAGVTGGGGGGGGGGH